MVKMFKLWEGGARVLITGAVAPIYCFVSMVRICTVIVPPSIAHFIILYQDTVTPIH